MQNLKRAIVTIVAAAGLTIAAGASAEPTMAGPQPEARLITGVFTSADTVTLDKTQFFFGGQNYCWYLDGWHGPGFYWCGYAWRRGFGWGGPAGWRGWGGGYSNGWRGGNWHGRWTGGRGPGYGRPGYRGGGVVGRPGYGGMAGRPGYGRPAGGGMRAMARPAGRPAGRPGGHSGGRSGDRPR